jgi:spermidine synthase
MTDSPQQPDRFQEISEADATTTYTLSRRIWEGRTTACDAVLVAESPAYGRMLFLEGELQSAAADENIYHEALVHPVMAAAVGDRRAPHLRVLVVGGGEGATVREVLRWQHHLAHVDWVDIDGTLVNLCREYLGWAPSVYDHSDVSYWAEDIQEALQHLGNYDVILLDLPDPDGETGWLYSPEFWSTLRSHLLVGGRLVTHCGPVRPWGTIGEGFQRCLATANEGGLPLSAAGFYAVSMPSFQGEWGFLMSGQDPWNSLLTSDTALPLTLKTVDDAQIRTWATKPKVWRTAFSEP